MVLTVCPVTVAGQDLLASGGEDGTVRIWDPATGRSRLSCALTGALRACTQIGTGKLVMGGGGRLYVFDYLPNVTRSHC
jgi:hypothetical protein